MNPDEPDALFDRLRAADPAASLPPATPESVARLLEDAMTDTLEHHEDRTDGTHGRSPLTWLVAAAAVVVIAAGGAFALTRGDDGTVTRDAPPAAAEPTVTELHAPSAVGGRCMQPNAQTLSGQTTAFDGTVTSIEGEAVTLEPTKFYAGDPTDLVTVEGPSEELQQLLSAVAFEEGERYLVAADDTGDVMVCGFSDAWSPELEQIYAEAFPS